MLLNACVVQILEPYDEFFHKLISSKCTVGEVFPNLHATLRLASERCSKENGPVPSDLNRAMTEQIWKRFEKADKLDPSILFASISDPRYKVGYKFFVLFHLTFYLCLFLSKHVT